MKFILKIFYIFISFIFIFIIYQYLLNKEIFNNVILNTVKNWLYYVLPSISISYICSMFLYNYPLISKLFYQILKPIYNFENQKACSIFLISIIVGNPCAIKLITNAVETKEISEHEGNRLLKFDNFISSIFIFSLFPFYTSLIIFIIELITTIILANVFKSSYYPESPKKQSISQVYFNIIDNLPNLLLSILFSMIFCSIISLLINNDYIISLLELANGIIIIKSLDNSLIKMGLLITLISTNGIAIILQSFHIIKKTSLLFKNFIKYHLISGLINLISLIIIYILFIFFF